MTLSITIPDAVAPRVLDAFAATYGWVQGVDGTKAQFAKQKVIAHIREVVRAYEATAAAEAARATAAADADAATNLS